MWVDILHVSCLPGIKEPGAQDHHSLARALFQLHLDGRKLLVDDLDHPLDLLGRDGASPRLFPEKIHHVGGELVASLEKANKHSKKL